MLLTTDFKLVMKLFGYKRRGMRGVFLLCASLMAGQVVSAQFLRDEMNLPDHDSKPYYIGIGFLYVNTHLQVSAHPKMLQSDSVLYVNPTNSGGFGVSGMFTFRVVKHLEFRRVLFRSRT